MKQKVFFKKKKFKVQLRRAVVSLPYQVYLSSICGLLEG